MLAVGALGLAGGALVAVGSFAQTGGPAGQRAAEAATEAGAASIQAILVGPDVTVFSFTDMGGYGSADGFTAYSVGTRSCNRGDTPLEWCDQTSGCAPGAATNDHPVIAQNLYRLKDGRFEQIGMSWLKHGFLSTNSNTTGCRESSPTGSCQIPPAGSNQLGIGCTDPYGSSLNGSRPLGKRSEVNATTGDYPFPYGQVSPSTVYDQRVKVVTADVDPALNSGAGDPSAAAATKYFAEGQYVAPDDAAVGNAWNNASYRRVTIGTSPSFLLSMTGNFFEKQSAIYAWGSNDVGVVLCKADVPGAVIERFEVARKVTALGGGQFHYEYAVRNHNSDRGARGFTVTFPSAATFTNVGFRDIDSHSGEVYSTTDWTSATTSTSISWFTNTFANDNNANALRWATMYNFWFDADQALSDDVVDSIELFKPGTPASIQLGAECYNDLFEDGFESGAFNLWGAERG